MVTQTEIENQEKGITRLSCAMQQNYLNRSPSWWLVDRGYIPTCEYRNTIDCGTWTEGVDFVVLDDEHIAFRLTGDYRDAGDWQIDTPDTFSEFVIEDAESWLAQWKEENQEGA